MRKIQGDYGIALSVLKLRILKMGDCDRLFSEIGLKNGNRRMGKFFVNLSHGSVSSFTGSSSSYPSVF